MARDNSTPIPSSAISFALKVLPPFREVVKSLTKPSPSTTRKNRTGYPPRPFLAILGQYLDEVEKCIKRWHTSGCSKGSSEEKQVLNLLTLLEEATKDTPDFQRKKPSTYSRSSYSNLEAIFRCLPPEKRNRAIKCIKNLGDIRSRSKSCREKLQAELENLGELTGDKSRECLSDLPTEGIKDADWAEHVQELHSILGEACACSSAGDPKYIANVGLAPIEVKTSKDSVPFSLFISHLHGNEDTVWSWKETQINRSHISPEEFCKLTRERTLSYPVLRGTRGSLTKERDNLRSIMVVNEPSMSLGNLISQKKLKDDDALRVKLSYLVAKAVWQFYDSHWMSEAWSKDTIHFMKEEDITDQSIRVYIQRPFITANMSSGKQDSSTPCISESETDDKSVSTCFHIYPKILSLGIILLEILRGEGIDTYRMQNHFRDDKGNLFKDADLVIAGLLMQDEKKGKSGKDEYSSNIRELLKEVIDFCIKVDVEKLGRDSKEVRANLRTHVVAPLYQLYSKSCPEDYVPDPIKVSLNSISKGASSSVSHNCRFGVSASLTVSDQQRLELRQVQNLDPIQHGIGLHDKIANYDADDGELQVGGHEVQREEARRMRTKFTDRSSRRRTDKWIEGFQNLLIKHNIEARSDPNVIKVAIIDSGIEYNHLEIDKSRIRDSKSWIENSDATVDKVGHGTHIAGIILQLTTNVQLYIGKVTDTMKFTKRDLITESLYAKAMAYEKQAIKQARTEWKVNMISLSFGFDNSDTNENREIQTCIDEKIIIFSSASNDGGEGSRSYPAAYDRIICIHSATPQGIAAAGNPIAIPQKDNFSTVGEMVKSYWHLPKVEEEGGNKGRAYNFSYKSGTSVATPVAVSIAAFMIGYLRKYAEGHEWGIEPWTPLGMQVILQKMKEDRDGYE
ncbi:hypothetical protein BOTCAL_0583g00020 [Botryotinia calthae]|uniref:Uncharacterized protein n=1 Tax=Botryotinia calthae TaxID=38488 RepID=A0A4Y8CLJ5_9HELO|nr:hypothetical protein BOTCAL_0583g00020 [Botryotinia calthae]